MQSYPVHPSTDQSIPSLSGQRLINYFTLKYFSPYATNYDAFRAATECKWTEVTQQLFSMQATCGCLIKTDFKTQPDPFKTKPLPPKKRRGWVQQLSKQIKCRLYLIFTVTKPSHCRDKIRTAAPNRKLQACHLM